MPEYEALLPRFEGYNAQVLGISTDQRYSNRAWAESMGGITYPFLSDFYPPGRVAKTYGVYRTDQKHGGQCERALFIIDTAGIIRYIDVHNIGEQPDPEDLFEVLRKL